MATTTNPAAIQKVETSPLIIELATEWKMSAITMLNTLKATVFPQVDKDKRPITVTNEQMMVFLQVCHEYRLNPFVKEIYAFPSKGGGIMPMVPVDGWSNIVNRNPQMNGVQFIDDWEIDDNGRKKSLFSTTCRLYRKDRDHPIEVTEYMNECYQGNKEPWVKWPARMLRHKAFIQCARIAFSLAGIYDPDEAERIAESGQDESRPHVIERPKSLSERTIEGASATVVVEPTTTGTAPESQPTTIDAKVTPNNCKCTCCKNSECTCKGKDEIERCGCPPCVGYVRMTSEPKPEQAEATNQPTGAEMFPQTQGSFVKDRPEGPYVPIGKLGKLFAIAKTAGIEVVKDSHDDELHRILKAEYGIESAKEIPQSLWDQVLNRIGGEKLKVQP